MNKKNYILMIILIFIDQITKILMINKRIVIIPNVLNFTYIKNPGVAFGIGKGYINLIIIINLLILVFIAIFLFKNSNKIKYTIPYCLIISGGISNLIDRIFRGYVIDFIDINLFNFPCFNIADICIVLELFLAYVKFINKICQLHKIMI